MNKYSLRHGRDLSQQSSHRLAVHDVGLSPIHGILYLSKSQLENYICKTLHLEIVGN